MDGNSFSPADLAAVTNNGMNGEGSWIWFLLIFVLLGWGGGYGNRGGAGPMIPNDIATQSGVQAAVNNQAINEGLNNIALSSANNNYETAQLINAQTNAFMQQNNTNQINMVQGFNNISNQLMNQTNQLGSKLDQLGYQMDQCCCSVKTQMLQDRLDDRNRQLVEAQNALNNAQQTQTILGNLGRFVAWAGSGSAAVTSAS